MIDKFAESNYFHFLRAGEYCLQSYENSSVFTATITMCVFKQPYVMPFV
jgi:hypothetical protein